MKKNELQSWVDFFVDRGLSEVQINKYIPYIDALLKKGVPIIFEKQHLSHLIGINENTLNKIINNPEKFYRKFNIKKKRGGEREISSPYPSLLMCQKWIYKNILLKDNPHDSCHGFTPKRSIITNAKIHINQKAILKLDLKDFFPSIPINWVIKYFQSLGYANNVAYYLAAICSFEKKLAQGASTSPYISNLLLKNLDGRLSSLSQKYKIRYSRYADDMCFSGEKIPQNFIKIAKEIITDSGLTINEDKTSLLINANKRIITGISVKGKTITVPREFKRNIKNELHFISKFGYLAHINHQKIKDPNYLLRLIGRVNFWMQVEPNNSDAKKALNMLNKINKNEIS